MATALDAKDPRRALAGLLGLKGVADGWNVFEPQRAGAGGVLNTGEVRRLRLAKRRALASRYTECPHCAKNSRRLESLQAKLLATGTEEAAASKSVRLSAKSLAAFKDLRQEHRCARCLDKAGVVAAAAPPPPDFGEEMIRLRMSIRDGLAPAEIAAAAESLRASQER